MSVLRFIAFRPANARGNPIHLLASHIAIEYVRQFKRVSLASSQSSLTTERPTVPNPAIATFSFLLDTGFFEVAGLFRDLDFERFALAAKSSPQMRSLFAAPPEELRIIRHF